MVPRSMGNWSSSVSRTARNVTGSATLRVTSLPTRARLRKWCGSGTRLVTVETIVETYCGLGQRLYFYRQHGGKVPNERHPCVAAIGRPVHLAAGGTEIDSARVEGVDGHGIAQYIDVAIALWQPVCERFPFVASRAASVHTQLSIRRIMFGVAFYGNDIDRFRLMCMDVDDKTKVGGEVAANLAPRFAAVVAAHHVPVFLHEKDVRF